MSHGPRTDEFEGANPGREQSERLKEARTAVLEGLAEALGNLHRLREITGERRGPELPRVPIGESATDGDLLIDLMRLHLDILNRVLAFGRDHADLFMSRLERTRAPRAGASLRALRITGHPGGEAVGQFVLENASRSEAAISVRASALTSIDCSEPFEGSVRVTPATARLGPGQEILVDVRVALEQQRFYPRQRYRGTIEVSSPESPRRDIPLWIEVLERPEPAEPAEPPAPADETGRTVP
ncbi:hypothetical protein [Polyangium sp. y55x31]|uniref:hypothetical protein n=1 Tax=Polyangium sp. y55x31 TaxID=3042688 RepID=UPI0024832780|nr:hypothetical protein [Polyangium sp. y55x31]MDI1476484.1 hypothetical protein [Polyangium sp. y55x31]